jgi:hypothetical protein
MSAASATGGTAVLYISGYGRSGSTVLDMLLGSHPGMLGTGEVVRLFEGWDDGESCSCGATLRECELWSAVMRRFQKALPDMTAAEAGALTRRVEGRMGAVLPHLGVSAADRERYGRVWRVVLSAIAEEAGARYVVDSSKSTRDTGGRALALSALAGAEVRVVHLVRDPRAVTWSMLRGSNRKLEAGEPARLSGGALRPLVGWLAANLRARATTVDVPCALLRYEDLVRRPEVELARVAEELGLDLDPVIEGIRSNEPLRATHGVAGNRLRRAGRQQLREDREWAASLPRSARLLATLTWPMARLYGYPVNRIGNEVDGNS